MKGPDKHLLAAGEPAPVTVYNPNGGSPFLLVADHAGNAIPRALGRLGVAEAECGGTSPGTSALPGRPALGGRARRDADPAKLFAPRHRLQPAAGHADVDPGSQRTHADTGQCRLERSQTRRRAPARFSGPITTASKPSSIAGGKPAAPTALIALHSFTPIFKGVARPWHVALLYNRDPRLPRRLLALLKAENGLIVGDNEPYAVSDATDYTIPVHGERRGLPHALIEIRQDLIAERTRAAAPGRSGLARLLPQAYAEVAAT